MGAQRQTPATRPRTRLMRHLGLMAAVLSGVLALAAPAFAAPNEWRVVPSPGGVAELSGVSCPTFYNCMAVGSGGGGALSESWNGRAWSVVPTAVVPEREPTTGELNGVSCVSDGFCAAVGKYFGYFVFASLSETWNGREWSIAPGRAGNTVLHDVSCVTSRFCVGVGISEAQLGPERQKIESWNGTEWSFLPTPEPKPPCTEFCFRKDEVLRGVSCVSTTFCVAVGWDDFIHQQYSSLVESWNGREWSVVPSPNGVGGFNELKGVSCVSADRCVAVGDAGNGALVESWNGKEWSILESPNPEGSTRSELNGVSCNRWGSCAAVGTEDTASGSQPLVETSQGTKWSLVPSAKGARADSELDRISCVPVLFLLQTCTAVGSTSSPEEGSQALVESSGIFF